MPFSEESKRAVASARQESSSTAQKEETKNSNAFLIELWHLEKVDLDNPDEIAERIEYYLGLTQKYGVRPAVASLAVAMRCHRTVLEDMRRGKVHRNRRTMEILSGFQSLMEAGLVEGAQNARNPAAFIFLLKATCGYQEINRIQIEQKQESMLLEDGATNIKALEQKYMNDVVIDVDGSELTLAKPITDEQSEE